MPFELRQNARSCLGHEFTLGRGKKRRADGTAKDKVTRSLHILTILPALLVTLEWRGGGWVVHGTEIRARRQYGLPMSPRWVKGRPVSLPYFPLLPKPLHSAKSSFLPYIHWNYCGSWHVDTSTQENSWELLLITPLTLGGESGAQERSFSTEGMACHHVLFWAQRCTLVLALPPRHWVPLDNTPLFSGRPFTHL